MSESEDSTNTELVQAQETAKPEIKTQAETTQPQPTTKDSSSGNSRRFPWGVVASLLLLLVIGATAGGAYYYWPTLKQYPQRIHTLEQTSNNLDQQLSELNRQLQQNQQHLSEYQQRLSEAQQVNQQLRSELEEQQQQIRTITATTSDDWKLAEAYYLSRMATQRLVLERNVHSALALLQAADDIVRARPDPQLRTVRKQLAQDIVALKLFNDVDREGVFLQLSALSGQLQNLVQTQAINYSELAATQNASATVAQQQVVQQQEVKQQAVQKELETGILLRIKNSFFSAVENMRDFIRVTHPGEAMQVPPSLEQQQQLQYSAQSLLQSAQLALLHDQHQIYQSSLQQAQDILEEHFSASKTAMEISALITQLRALSFDKTLPDISQSEVLLGQYLDHLHRVGGVDSNFSPSNHSPSNPSSSNNSDSGSENTDPGSAPLGNSL